MGIWFTLATPEQLNQLGADTLVSHIDIVFHEVGEDYITASMPVDARTVQPARILHGGASVVLAETLGSVAANLCVDPARKICVGMEINANHVTAARSGRVTGTVRPVHIGSSTHIWQTRIHDDQNRLVCISRLTLAVLDHKRNGGNLPVDP
jgi:1,4-dihydroxy-2-naphthoyl-CoA hydrolase